MKIDRGLDLACVRAKRGAHLSNSHDGTNFFYIDHFTTDQQLKSHVKRTVKMLIPKADRKKIHESVLLITIRTSAIEIGSREIVHIYYEPCFVPSQSNNISR